MSYNDNRKPTFALFLLTLQLLRASFDRTVWIFSFSLTENPFHEAFAQPLQTLHQTRYHLLQISDSYAKGCEVL